MIFIKGVFFLIHIHNLEVKQTRQKICLHFQRNKYLYAAAIDDSNEKVEFLYS